MGDPTDTRPTLGHEWEPQPLQLPVEPTNRSTDDAPDRERSGDEDLPGSYVIVIDLA